MNFKITLLSACLPAIALLPASASDQITLKQGNVIHGKIISLETDLIEIKTPHAETPLKVKGQTLQHLKFDQETAKDLPTHSEKITLKNGDVFPAEVLSLDHEKLKVQTWFAGTIDIPRPHVKSVHYGLKPQPLIYQGPKDIKEWRQQNSWAEDQKTKNSFFSTNTGEISKAIAIPKNFIFQTTLSWRNTPNIRIYLCANDHETKFCLNAYRISFSGQNIQLERLIEKNKSEVESQFLGDIGTKTTDFPTNQFKLEVRANREDRTLAVYLDGHLRKTFLDQNPAPKGNIMIFESLIPRRQSHIIEHIACYEWDTITQHLHREGPVDDPKLDSVSVADGDRYSGKIIGISEEQLTLRSPVIDHPLEIPTSHCSVLHFENEHPKQITRGAFGLNLANGGTLGLESIQLDQELRAQHPMLGKLNLDRRILSSITRQAKQSATQNND